MFINFVDSGRGVLFHYDAVGSREQVRACCTGNGEKMMQPLLDSHTQMERDDALWTLTDDGSEFVSSNGELFTNLTKSEAIELSLRAFRAAAEREITVGDGVHIWIVSSDNRDNKSEPSVHIDKRFYPLPQH